jgi:1,2-diacylglycerol 3-alpha-glucosyltransferase
MFKKPSTKEAKLSSASLPEEQGNRQGKIKVALFSSGLGAINRGFEISTARFYRNIAARNILDAKLYAGADYPDAHRIWCIGRNKWLKGPLSPFSFMDRERLWKMAYALEQTSFSFGLVQESFKQWQPDVVWTKEVPLAHVLYEFRRLSGKNYKIIFANGGGFRPSTYQQFDFIQHLHPEAYEEAKAFGLPDGKMNVLPNMVPSVVPQKSKPELRREFGYEDDDWIVICVAAWNSHHKRIDYLIEEVARLGDERCKLLIVGEPEPEGLALQKMAEVRMGNRVRFMTAPEERVHDLMHMSDVFVLCSLYEGLGAVMIEAALAGLPLVCHPHGGSRYILQDERWMVNMSESGNLAERLGVLRHKPFPQETINDLREKVHARFNVNKLSRDFEQMVEQVYGGDQNCMITQTG